VSKSIRKVGKRCVKVLKSGKYRFVKSKCSR
jgi:hypothetical protein